MQYLARFAPVRAVNDLRRYLAQRPKYELGFLFLSIVITTLLITGFIVDSRMEKPYERKIQYVESWPADRSDDQIRADQRRDMAVKTKADATREKFQADRKAAFKRVDDQLNSLGL